MRPFKIRQPRLRLCALFLAAAQPLLAASPGAAPVAQQLLEARTQAIALAARDASVEEWAKLERAFADLATRYSQEPSVRSAYAEFLWEREDRERAIREWESAERLAPKDATVLERLADAHLAAGRGKVSARYFQKACDAAPDDARLRHAAGNAIFLFRHELVDGQMGEAQILAAALAHLAAAARLAPQDAEYARAYAETFYGLPKPDWAAALAAWTHFLAISPNGDFAHANLARVRLNMGHIGAARRELDAIQSPEFERLKSSLKAQIDSAELQKPTR